MHSGKKLIAALVLGFGFLGASQGALAEGCGETTCVTTTQNGSFYVQQTDHYDWVYQPNVGWVLVFSHSTFRSWQNDDRIEQ